MPTGVALLVPMFAGGHPSMEMTAGVRALGLQICPSLRLSIVVSPSIKLIAPQLTQQVC